MASLNTSSSRSDSQPQPHPFDPSPPNEHASSAWRYVRAQLTADVLASGTPQAHLPLTEIFGQMPPSDQQWVLSAFQNLVNSPSQWTLLPQHDVAVFHLTNYGPENGQKSKFVSRSDKMVRRAIMKKVPRPLNSFILYRKDRQEIVKEEHPDLTNNEISKILGEQWRGETRETRAFYKAKADQAKLEHVTRYPDYQYRPRRPEEKKRRMTKNKKLKLEQRLQAEQMAASMINNRIDPSLLDKCDMGYIVPSHSDTRPSVAGISMVMADTDFDIDSQTRAAAERDIENFLWDDLNNLVNLEHTPDVFNGDYMPESGVIPGSYLMCQ